MTATKTISDVQERIDTKKARVYTASEFKAMVRNGGRPTTKDVDVITCGTMGIMSGTMAVMTVPVTGPGVFKRADSIRMNGVPGTVGPCPNESLGIVDCILYGTSRRDHGYGGGHLFRDLVAGKPVDVEVVSEGETYVSKITLGAMPFARMILTRGAFKNYTCFVNGSENGTRTIFSGPEPLGCGLSEASVSGCGAINPIQNDPELRYLRPGASVMLNGAPGMIIGTGTRSTADKPNLSITADMHSMRADFIGGFRTSEGPECLTSVAAAIPILDDAMLDDASVLDEDVTLPIADVADRIPVSNDDYGSVWGDGAAISRDMTKCLHCSDCPADSSCPTDAFPSGEWNMAKCISCGFCISRCRGKVFVAHMGSVDFNGNEVPIVIRQSSREKAEELCDLLKTKIMEGKWRMEVF